MLLSKFKIDEKYLAHTPNESLIAHLNLTLEYLNKVLKVKNLDGLIDNLIYQIDNKNYLLIKEMFINAIFLHDLGKKNPCFQSKKMNNPLFKEYKDCGNSKHSHIGALEFIEYYKKNINIIEDDTLYNRLIFILYNFAYHIDKHHGALENIESYFSKTNQELKEHPDFNNVKKDINLYLDKEFEFYILNRVLFSLLISSDYYATTEYMTNSKIDDFGVFDLDDKNELIDSFQKYISKFKNPTTINRLRNEIFIEAEKNLLQNLSKNIFYLEAPTGSGKTITSINLALKLLESDDNLNKLLYIFPFNTLVEQTKNVFDEIFGDILKVEVINSITPIKIDENAQEEEETKYEKAYINRLFFHSSAILTTHISLFNILFGTSKEDIFPLWQLANSVIIIDEIQSYDNNLWWYMVEFFDKYANLLNIKVIIMSATLPKLDYFLEQKDSFVELISNRDYFFKNSLFKDRVKVDFSLLNKKMNYEKLSEILTEQPKDKKILFEFIKKQSARDFYNLIKDEFENVYELSGDDNKIYREFIINKSKNENLIIIATQVIEAGVDIDMDIGFKDISTIDGEEQFMGRINRNCLRDGKVYFFDMDSAEKIYKNDNRLGMDLKQQKYRDILENKNFGEYYKDVLEIIKKNGDKFQNGLLTNYENFTELVKKLNYEEIAKTMTLINSQNFTLYFPFKIDISNYKNIKEFKNIDNKFLTDNMLDGQKIWDKFVLLNDIKKFSKREVEKSKINSLMQFFTFNIKKYDFKATLPYYNYEFGGYYFIENYSDFIIDGKFDRAKYLAKKDEMFV